MGNFRSNAFLLHSADLGFVCSARCDTYVLSRSAESSEVCDRTPHGGHSCIVCASDSSAVFRATLCTRTTPEMVWTCSYCCVHHRSAVGSANWCNWRTFAAAKAPHEQASLNQPTSEMADYSTESRKSD